MTKSPTSTDLKVLGIMKEHGGIINSMWLYENFQCTSHRDIFYRLRKAGHEIESKVIHYKNEHGERKCYTKYSLKDSQAA